jgi:hypothetical protein
VLGAVLFVITALFKKANEVEAGHLDEVDAHYVPHEVAEASLGQVAQSSKTYQQMLFR